MSAFLYIVYGFRILAMLRPAGKGTNRCLENSIALRGRSEAIRHTF